MTVPVYKRRVAKTEYLKELHNLNMDCGRVIHKYPKKYVKTYGSILVNDCIQALVYGMQANRIKMGKNTTEENKTFRRQCFEHILDLSERISVVSYIFFEQAKRSGELVGRKCERVVADQALFGVRCETISRLVRGVMKYDRQFS